MKTISCILTAILVLVLTGCNQGKRQAEKAEGEIPAEEPQSINTLTSQETEEGWVLLFDGKTTQGWKNFNEDTLTGWLVEDGCLVGQGLGGDIGGDIVSLEEYENFILQWEWKLGPHGNSGVMYHVIEDPAYAAAYETGPEYQLIEDDDYRNEDGSLYPLEEWQKTAADYAMYVPNDQKKVNVRDWNSSRIVFSPEKAEYWLNGKKVVEFVPWSDDWYQRRNSGKWDAYPDYGLARNGKICLQDHGSKVWFRNIKIRELE
jgi:hypothetical protein